MTDLSALDLSLTLTWPEPKQFCTAQARNKHGWVVAACTLHTDHNDKHRDVHTGHTWEGHT